MALRNTPEKAEFVKIFNAVARHKHRYSVFSDFVVMSAISLHNAVNMNDDLEKEYLDIIAQYSKEEAKEFPKLFSCLVELLESKPADVLGALYMELELGNKNTGQFFTPSALSEMMAQINYDTELRELNKPFITLSEPACGAGGMVLAFANVMISYKHNPAEKLWVQCIDIDRVAAFMCYLQLSLWNIPAQVIVGNTLSLELREQYFTPAHYLYDWDTKLRWKKMMDYVVTMGKEAPKEEQSASKKDEVNIPKENTKPQVKRRISTDAGQLDMF